MKIITVETPVTISSVIQFSPWPFKEVEIPLADPSFYFALSMGWCDESDNEGEPFKLMADDDNVLVTLSDGRLVVTDMESLEALRFHVTTL